MPVFRLTKKLATALKVRVPKEPPEPSFPQHEWFADLFFIQGKKAVIWTHRTTLLTFVRPGVTAAELREFHALFRYEFRTIIASLALPDSLLDRFNVYGPESYAPTNDRGIVGSMLDHRKMFDWMIDQDGGLGRADVAGLNAQLNDTPMSLLDGDSALRRITVLTVEDGQRLLH